MLDGQRRLVHIEAETGARGLEALADHPRIRAAPCHALAERRVIVLATASLANQRKDVALAVGEIGLQPLAEQVAHLKRQPQQNVAGRFHPTGGCRFENSLDLCVIDGRDNGCRHHGGRNAGGGKLA